MTEKTDWDLDHSAKALKREFGEKVEIERPLSELNTFGTGGKARLFLEIETTAELSSAVRVASQLNIPIFMLGGGSNVLISDSGYNGLIIKNSIMGLGCNGEEVTCGAGEELQKLVDFTADNSLSGLEFATGIWGTVGGAIYGNAGAYGSEIGAVIKSAELVDRQGDIRTVSSDYLKFSYRSSKLKETGEFITRAIFALKIGKKEIIEQKVAEIMSQRSVKLPIGEKSAGCFFKNIPDKESEYGKLSTGKLLEEIGAKEMRFGGARVFKNHANIIINDGSADSTDIRKLADLMKSKVEDKFGIKLQEEVICLGDFKEEFLTK
jgi:UDP-N-acetylmuramate dehydrogenase